MSSVVKIHWRMLILECSQRWYAVKIDPVIFTFDLWRWKSTEFQIPLRTRYVRCLVKIHCKMIILECSQGCYGRADGGKDGRKGGWTEGRMDGSVTISLLNFVCEGIINHHSKRSVTSEHLWSKYLHRIHYNTF